MLRRRRRYKERGLLLCRPVRVLKKVVPKRRYHYHSNLSRRLLTTSTSKVGEDGTPNKKEGNDIDDDHHQYGIYI